MIYHSEPVTRSITLWLVKKLYIQDSDKCVVDMVEKGARLSVSNTERKEYFRYAGGLIPWFGVLCVPISVLLLWWQESVSHTISLWTLSMWLPLFMPFSVSAFLFWKFRRCDTAITPVTFTTLDLIGALLAVILAYISFIGFIWLLTLINNL